MSSITFLGAAGTVTGSRHLIEHDGRLVLLDCGLFQGEKEVRQRNWASFPVPPRDIDAVVLSHAHIDHTGWLPRLVREGFRGPVYSTPATADLAEIMLPDSGRLQEEEAGYANKKGYSKHRPALPLYTEDDARHSLEFFKPLRYGATQEVARGIAVTFHRAGHILGSAIVRVELRGGGRAHTLVYSGDLGRYGMPVIPDPEPLRGADSLVVECTYGDRRHEAGDPREALGALVRDVIEQKRVLVIPAFAIGRTQDILYHLRQLQLSGHLPSVPIFVDSPMACDATPLYVKHRDDHDDEMSRQLAQGRRPLQPFQLDFVRGIRESKALNSRQGPMIILSASGMATGGRVLHHLANRLPDPRTTVLFVGYQAAGSRGRRLLDGERFVRIHGEEVPVRARIETISGFSAHADWAEVDRWLGSFASAPATTYCVHGEAGALEAMRARLDARGWKAKVPAHGERCTLE